jgi:hypothetical protein
MWMCIYISDNNFLKFLLLIYSQEIHLTPSSDFYKKLALDCSGQQVAVDLFLLSGQYSEWASLYKFFMIFFSSVSGEMTFICYSK